MLKIVYLDFMLEPDHLRTFTICAETLNFSEAGQRLGRVQSAISAQIARLEMITDQTLFERGRGRSMTLTPSGEKLLVHAERLLRLNAEALQSVRSSEISSVVRFGTTETYAAVLLPDILRRFASQYADVRVDVICARSRDLLAALDAGDVDLVLMTDQGYRQNRILEHECDLAWVARPDFASPSPQPLPVAFMPPGCEFRAAGLKALERSERDWRLAMSSPSPTGIRAAIDAGLAVTVMPKIAFEAGPGPISQLENLPPLGRVRVVAHGRKQDFNPATNDFAHKLRLALDEKAAVDFH